MREDRGHARKYHVTVKCNKSFRVFHSLRKDFDHFPVVNCKSSEAIESLTSTQQ